LGTARQDGDFAHCGERPETLSLDSAAFEKAGETFHCASRWGISLTAVSGQGRCPWTLPPFEKGGRKLFLRFAPDSKR